MTAAAVNRATCTHPSGCDRPVVGRGLCNTHHQAYRTRMIAYGKWDPDRVPAEPVRERIEEFRALGIGLPALATITGTPERTLENVVYANWRWVKRRTYRSVMAVHPHQVWQLAPDTVRLDALGTTRRLRALAALGHRRDELTAQLGLGRTALTKLFSGSQLSVTAKRAREIAALFDDLAMTPGRCDRTRQMAARKGWAPPLAWDDIDSPDDRPRLGRREYVPAIERIEELMDLGITDPELMAQRLGVKPESVRRELARHRQREAERQHAEGLDDDEALQEAS